MQNSNPEPDQTTCSDEELQVRLQEARHNLAVNERADELSAKLSADWEAYRLQRIDKQDTGASPVSLLKIEALAAIRALAGFHCYMAHELIEAQLHEEAHHWAVDEGYLNAAHTVLAEVSVEQL